MNKNVKYVQQKRVAPLLNDMVCHLVTTLPDDPLEGLVHYLEKRFPDEAARAAEQTGIPVGQMTAGGANVNRKRTESGVLIPSPPSNGERGDSPGRTVIPKLGAAPATAGSSSVPTTPGRGVLSSRGARASLGGPAGDKEELHALIQQLQENEELMMGTIAMNRQALKPETDGVQGDRLAAIKAEGFCSDFLDLLSTVESNYRSGQGALSTAYFGDGEAGQTPQVLLQRIWDNEAAFAQLLTKAARSSHARKEKEHIEEAIEKSQEMQGLLDVMSQSSNRTMDVVYDTLYRQALGAVSEETDPSKLLALLESNESVFLDQISAARKESKSVMDRALLAKVEQRSISMVNTVEEMQLNTTSLTRVVQEATADGGQTNAEAHRVVHELLHNEELFLEQLTAAAQSETNPNIRKMLQAAICSSEEAVEAIRGIENTGADVELSFAVLYGSLSPQEIATLRALRMIEEINVENEKMRSKVQVSLHQDSEAQAEAEEATRVSPRGHSPNRIIENYAEVEAVEKLLQGQQELQQLLATAQERELLIESALGHGTRGLEGTALETALQMRDVVERLKLSTADDDASGRISGFGRQTPASSRPAGHRPTSRLMGRQGGSPVVTLVEMLMSSVDLVAGALEPMLDIGQRSQLTHLQICTRKTCLLAQLLPSADHNTAAAKKLFTECQDLTRRIMEFYGSLELEHKGEIVALKQQTEMVRSVAGFCEVGVVAEALLADA